MHVPPRRLRTAPGFKPRLLLQALLHPRLFLLLLLSASNHRNPPHAQELCPLVAVVLFLQLQQHCLWFYCNNLAAAVPPITMEPPPVLLAPPNCHCFFSCTRICVMLFLLQGPLFQLNFMLEMLLPLFQLFNVTCRDGASLLNVSTADCQRPRNSRDHCRPLFQIIHCSR